MAITAAQVQESLQAIYKHSLVVDKRISVMELKLKIASYFDMSLAEIVFRRGGSHGTELVEDDDSLKQAQFYRNMSLYLEKGIPSQMGQKRITFFLARYSSQTELEKTKEVQGAEAIDTSGVVKVPDNCFFFLEELAEIPVKTALKNNMMKSFVIENLKDHFPDLVSVPEEQIRLREKTGEDKLSTVLHECKDFGRYQIYDGKEIAI